MTLLGESFAHQCLLSVLVLEAHLSNELGALELLEAVSDALAGGESGVLGTGAVPGLGGVVLSESVDSDLSAHIELVGNGGSANIEPVWVVWRQVLVASGFIVGGPLIKI